MLFVAACAAVALSIAPQKAGIADAAGCVKISRIYFDSPGADNGSNSSLNAEWIQLKSNCAGDKSLGGYRIRDRSHHNYTFGSFTIQPGETVKVHTGAGANTAAHVYQDADGYIWNNDGDKAFLYNASGTLVRTCAYSGAGDAVSC